MKKENDIKALTCEYETMVLIANESKRESVKERKRDFTSDLF